MRVTKRCVLLSAAIVLLVCGLKTVYADIPPGNLNQTPSIPDVVARVNGSDISSKYIKFEFMQILKNTQVPMTSVQKDMVIRRVINKEVVRELMYQEGQKLNFKVDREIVEDELTSLRSAYENEDDFKRALIERNITEVDLKRSIKVDALAKLILEKQVKGQVKIDNEAVQKYYVDNKKNFRRPVAFRASHVLISPYPPDMIRNSKVEDLQARKKELWEKAHQKILEIQTELNKGADMAELAKKYSHDESTAKNGGDLGFFYGEGVEKTFADAVAKLEAGEVTDVVKTSFGFHLVKLIDTKAGEYAPFEDMEEAIQKHLFIEKAQDRVSDYVSGLRKKAKIEVFY